MRCEDKGEPVVLTIAGHDPSGGAGIVADIKTIIAFNCYATAAVTSLTYQNKKEVSGASHQTAETVRAQVLPVVAGFKVAGAKTGVLPTREIILEVARLLRETNLPAPVVDPVMRSTSGYDFVDEAARDALRSELMPLAALITPNIPEAECLTGLTIRDEDGMRRAAARLREMGARAVLIKGGHFTAGDALDLLDEGTAGGIHIFRAARIMTETPPRGTGCTLSAAIAACLARGISLEESIDAAKRYVTSYLTKAVTRTSEGRKQ